VRAKVRGRQTDRQTQKETKDKKQNIMTITTKRQTYIHTYRQTDTEKDKKQNTTTKKGRQTPLELDLCVGNAFGDIRPGFLLVAANALRETNDKRQAKTLT
jgi:hypothetical protein